MIIIWIFLAYFLFVFVFLRLIIPHLGFFRRPIPENIPEELRLKIKEINEGSESNAEFLKNSYDYVVQRYSGNRLKTVTEFWKAFGDAHRKESGFLPCTGQNYLLRTILVKSGRFSEQDIKIKVTVFNLFIHQYLQVRVGEGWINVDPWANFLGVPFGKRLSYFG